MHTHKLRKNTQKLFRIYCRWLHWLFWRVDILQCVTACRHQWLMQYSSTIVTTVQPLASQSGRDLFSQIFSCKDMEETTSSRLTDMPWGILSHRESEWFAILRQKLCSRITGHESYVHLEWYEPMASISEDSSFDALLRVSNYVWNLQKKTDCWHSNLSTNVVRVCDFR